MGFLCFASAVEICDANSGMDDPQKIPEGDMELPTGSSGSPVSSTTPLTIPVGESPATIVLDLGGTPNYPNEAPIVQTLDFNEADIENVASIEIFYKSDESDSWTPLPSNVRFFRL